MKENYYINLTQGNKKVEGIIKQLHVDISNQLGNVGFPFIFIADALPNKKLIIEKISYRITEGFLENKVILIITNPARNNYIDEWELMQLGINDIYNWAGEDDFKNYILFTIQRQQKITSILNTVLIKDNLIGQSKVWKNFLAKIVETTLFSQCSFLLTGESGTGKELISRLIHTLDTRQDKQDLILIDCTTIMSELSGSEFFGHERGSYTNALNSREGAFALANRGTLFLDEIGELSFPLQAGLLRVIQEGTYKKIGSNTWQKTNFRLVCATHRNLRQQIDEKRFRQDLFYRISDVEFTVPSLSERKEDISLLANYFLKQFIKGNDVAEFDDNVLDFLQNRNYPGNIRELRQLIQRIALRHVQHKKITIGEIPIEERKNACHQQEHLQHENSLDDIVKQMILKGDNYNGIKEKIGSAAFEAAINICGGNKQKAAERLGVDVRTVQLGVKRKG
jgi:transcriptional regulator with GAF, ATPase, and Fis domain